MKTIYKIGDFVEYRNSSNEAVKGIVYRVDENCKQSIQWLAIQKNKPNARQINSVWYGLLVDGGGSVTIEEDRLKKIPAFAIENSSIKMYHPELLNFIPFQR